MRGKVQSGTIDVAAGDKDFRFRRGMDLARQNTIRANAPVFRTAILLEHLEALSPPGAIGGNAETLPDDAIDFSPEQQLVHRELLAGAQRGRGFVANLQNGGARHRLLVILDLVLYVKLVLVSEGPRILLRHGVGLGTSGVSQVFKLGVMEQAASANLFSSSSVLTTYEAIGMSPTRSA